MVMEGTAQGKGESEKLTSLALANTTAALKAQMYATVVMTFSGSSNAFSFLLTGSSCW